MRTSLVALLAVLLTPAALAVSQPTIRPVTLAPARVAGTGFEPGERVTVTIRTDAGYARAVVRSTRRGSFVVRFAKAVPRTPCGQVLLRARGARGDQATWKSPPPVCGTQLAP